MDPLEIEFDRLVRSRDFEQAEKALTRWLEKSSPSVPDACHSKAFLMWQSGNPAGAIDELSKVIESGQDPSNLCRIQRAQIRLAQGELANALADHNAILQSDPSTTSTAYQNTARFRTAYILARLGSAEFTDVIELILPDDRDRIGRQILGRDDLIRMYQGSQKAPPKT